MTPVQSQPIGQYLLAAPGIAGAGRPAGGTVATALDGAFSQNRPSLDSIQTGGCDRRPLPNPIAGGPLPVSPVGALDPPTTPTPGSTGNSFLDLIAQLMSQLDSVISGLGGGTSSGGTGSTQPPVCSAPLQPDPGDLTSQPGSGSAAMRRLLATGEVT